MANGFKTTVTDRGAGKVFEAIATLKRSPGGPRVRVGILESAGQHKGAEGRQVIDIAVDNEFGTDRIPERPFMRTAAKELEPEMAALGDKLLAAVIAGTMTVDHALDVIGLKAQAGFKKRLTEGPWTPNAPMTIAKKGSDRPLIDTGQMRDSIQYEKVK